MTEDARHAAPKDERKPDQTRDALGRLSSTLYETVLIVGALVLSIWALMELRDQPWDSPVHLLSYAVALLALYTAHSWRRRKETDRDGDR